MKKNQKIILVLAALIVLAVILFIQNPLKKTKNEIGIVTIKNKNTNEQIIPVRSFWFAWFAFHPDTELYKK